jgi:(p)ppGpp synthase/HD superfamily hydrolase
MEYGANEDEAIAALLHDAAEDQGGERIVAEIRAKFGEAVADIVYGCSDAFAEAGEKKERWEKRKAKYIAHLYHASNSVKLVSVADKLHNARSILAGYRELGDKVFDRFKGAGENKKQKILWYYRKLSATYNQLLPGKLADELARTVATLVEVANANNDQKATDEQTQVDRSMDDILARELAAAELLDRGKG